jgi:hypothetical protein
MARGVKTSPVILIIPLIVAGGFCLFLGQNSVSLSLGSIVVTILSAVLFSIHSMVFKQMQAEFGLDHMAVLYQTCKISVFLNLCGFFAFNWGNIDVLWDLGEMLEGRMPFLLFLNGVGFFTSVYVSLSILDKFPIESYAIGNGLMKLLVVVCFLHDSSPVNIIGVCISLTTLFFYVTRMGFSNEVLPEQQSPITRLLLQDQFTQTQSRQKQRVEEAALNFDSNSVRVTAKAMATGPVYLAGTQITPAPASDEVERLVTTEVGEFELIM